VPLLSGLRRLLSPRRSATADRGPVPFDYAPRADGRPDPGEVVWAWVPYEEDLSRGKDRPVLVIGAEDGILLALPLTSKDHDRDARQEASEGRFWMDIGPGPWDPRGRPSEVRLNRLLRLRSDEVRREGAALAPAVFDAVIEASRAYG
jgi:hypothetical protein